MRRVTYSLSSSLDGYAIDSHGSIDWGIQDPELFALATDEVREVDVHLLGRRLYEAMLFWEGGETNPALDDAQREFAAIWNAIPKVVFSRTLTAVEGNARLAAGSLAEEIARLRTEPGDGVVALGGAHLAAQAAALDLIDEYRVRVHPVLVGGGVPYFAHDGRQVRLELLESRSLACGVVYHRHRVVR